MGSVHQERSLTWRLSAAVGKVATLAFANFSEALVTTTKLQPALVGAAAGSGGNGASPAQSAVVDYSKQGLSINDEFRSEVRPT